jgi:hypothetical protein
VCSQPLLSGDRETCFLTLILAVRKVTASPTGLIVTRLFFDSIYDVIYIKLSMGLINSARRYEDVWKNGSTAPPFLISALDVGEWLASLPDRYTSEE